MNLATETATSPKIHPGLLADSLARTDQEFWNTLRRPRSKPAHTGALWTRDSKKEHTEDATVKYYVWLENYTAQQERPEEIDQGITILFEAAKEQDFEDGMESEFSKELVYLIKKYGNAAMEIIADLIIYERGNAEVASEALRWLGHMDHPMSYHSRLWLLERSLGCSSAMVRDGAALGLASLDDPHAIPYLKQAILRENCSELRGDMEQVLVQLENTH